jgi:peptide/nickel transport system substrate-binding protein
MSGMRPSWMRAGSARVSRRTLMRTGAVVGAAAFLSACGGGGESRPSSNLSAGTTAGGTAVAAEGPPKPGGILREATIVQAPHFSPFHPGADPAYVNMWRRVYGYYDPLWGYKSVTVADRLHLMLASGFEQPDPTTVIVKLKPSTFHNRPPANGRALTAEDVAAMVTFLRKPPASGGSFLQSGKDLKAVSAVDDSTLRFETFGPRAFFFEEGGGVRVIPPKEMLDEKTLKEQIPVGSGPYEYKAHTQGSTEEVKRNDNYRIKEQPYITERRLTFVPDTASIEAAFRAGQIDTIAFTDIKQKEAVGKDLGNKIVLRDRPSATGGGLVVNINRAPWNDARVREAIYRAIDFDRIINVVYFGGAEKTWYFSKARTTRNPLGPEPVKQHISYDPKRSTDLLKQAGIDPNKEYELMAPSEGAQSIDMCRLIAEDLGKVGMKVRVNPVVRNIYLQRGGPKLGDFDMTLSVLLDYNYAQTNSGTFWDSTSLQDPEVDALVEKIQQTVDVQARDKLSHEFETMLARKYSNFIPLISTIENYGWYAYLKGVNPDFHPYSGIQAGRWLDK